VAWSFSRPNTGGDLHARIRRQIERNDDTEIGDAVERKFKLPEKMNIELEEKMNIEHRTSNIECRREEARSMGQGAWRRMGRAEPGVMGFTLPITFSCVPGYSRLTMQAIPIEQKAAQPIILKKDEHRMLKGIDNPACIGT
jgi:hypothetical protein